MFNVLTVNVNRIRTVFTIKNTVEFKLTEERMGRLFSLEMALFAFTKFLSQEKLPIQQ